MLFPRYIFQQTLGFSSELVQTMSLFLVDYNKFSLQVTVNIPDTSLYRTLVELLYPQEKKTQQ